MNNSVPEIRTLKYLDVYYDLKNAILNGQYLRGSFLPAESSLMKLYSVSRTTIRKAVSLLETNKLVRVQQGRGTEVIYGKTEVRPSKIQIYHDVLNLSSVYSMEGESVATNSLVDMIPAPDSISKPMEIEENTMVYRVRRLKALGNTPFNYVVSYVPCNLAPGLEAFNGQVFLLYQCLKEEYHIISTSVNELISADTAKYLESTLLSVPFGSPLIYTRRTARYEGGVMEYTESHIRPDIYQISVTMKGGLNYVDR